MKQESRGSESIACRRRRSSSSRAHRNAIKTTATSDGGDEGERSRTHLEGAWTEPLTAGPWSWKKSVLASWALAAAWEDEGKGSQSSSLLSLEKLSSRAPATVPVAKRGAPRTLGDHANVALRSKVARDMSDQASSLGRDQRAPLAHFSSPEAPFPRWRWSSVPQKDMSLSFGSLIKRNSGFDIFNKLPFMHRDHNSFASKLYTRGS